MEKMSQEEIESRFTELIQHPPYPVAEMLTLIGANTATIQRKTIKLRNLEEKKQELMEKNDEIQRRIQELQTEESIIERATQAGLLD